MIKIMKTILVFTIFKIVYRRILMYDSATWTVNAIWNNKLQATEMKYS